MKIVVKFLLILCIINLTSSCKKQSDSTNEGLVGKWRLVETFNGYANGGDFTWRATPSNHIETIELKDNNQYLKFTSSMGSIQNCIGTYNLPSNDVLQINSSCNTVPQEVRITTLNGETLVIKETVREGHIDYKYIRE